MRNCMRLLRVTSLFLLCASSASYAQGDMAMNMNMPAATHASKHVTQHTKAATAPMVMTTARDHMHGMYGSYAMTQESSGTSWQPQSTPLTGLMFMTNQGMYMLQGFADFIFDHQGGPRGSDLGFSTNMLMFMAQKDISVGTVGFRSMFSVEPVMGKGGYPLLLQTGETANGRTPLVDQQHPHNAIMELAGTFSVPIRAQQSAYLYAGLVGEPALGPPNFMMRWSALDIPEAPLTHHWMDSTHTTFGVITLGYIYNQVKFEVSKFNGREPDQNRWQIQSPKLDSQSVRMFYNPTADWSLQASYGHLKSPEQLSPNVNTNRATASAIYNKPFCAENNWQTTLAWGQNKNYPGHTLNGYMLESAVNLRKTHNFFGRAERVQEDELFFSPSPLADTVFTVNKLSLGYLYEFAVWRNAKPGLGALVSTYALPSAIQPSYGARPFSYMVFGRISLA